MPVECIEQAGLDPTVEQIELFSSHLPNAKLHEILTLFLKMAKLDGNYFLCDIVRQIELASSLQNVNMPLRDLYKFTRSPVEPRKLALVKALVQLGHAHSCVDKVSFKDLCRILRSFKTKPFGDRALSTMFKLEERHEIIELYLWLSMRFPETFMEPEKARELQEKVEGMMNKSIERLSPKSVQVEKKLSRKEEALSDHLLGVSPHLLHRLEDLARSGELSNLSTRERKRFRKELNTSLKHVMKSKKVLKPRRPRKGKKQKDSDLSPSIKTQNSPRSKLKDS